MSPTQRKQLLLSLLVLFLLNITLISLAQAQDSPMISSSASTSQEVDLSTQDLEVQLLAQFLTLEAQDLSLTGQVAVGAVVCNRVNHPSYPNTLAGVIFQPGAFPSVWKGTFGQAVTETALLAAQEALSGVDPSGGALAYFNPDEDLQSGLWARPLLKCIDSHRFCG